MERILNWYRDFIVALRVSLQHLGGGLFKLAISAIAISTIVYIYDYGLLSAKGMEKVILNVLIAIFLIAIVGVIKLIKKSIYNIQSSASREEQSIETKKINSSEYGQATSNNCNLTRYNKINDFPDEQQFSMASILLFLIITALIIGAGYFTYSNKYTIFTDREMVDMLIDYSNTENYSELFAEESKNERVLHSTYYVTDGDLHIDKHLNRNKISDFYGRIDSLKSNFKDSDFDHYCKDSDKTITYARHHGITIITKMYDMDDKFITMYKIDLGKCN